MRPIAVIGVLVSTLVVMPPDARAATRSDVTPDTATTTAARVDMERVPDGSATRQLPATHVVGTPLTVTIVVAPGALTAAQAIEDSPPAGWTIGTISDSGAWDAVNGKVKWGPYFDATARTLTYVVTPPAVGVGVFSGVASFDGPNVSIAGSTSVTVIAQVTPAITWANPASIVQGTALSATQLNATASYGGSAVGGTFAYTPVAGTVLPVGIGQTLSVIFTPTDAVAYTTASKSVTINVTRADGAPTFSDDPLMVGATTVKAAHITELRQATETLRSRYGLGAVSWTDTTPTAGVTPVKAVHVTELRTALNAVYTAASRTAPAYSHASITSGATVITAVDVAELRAAILAIW